MMNRISILLVITFKRLNNTLLFQESNAKKGGNI